MIQSDVAFEVLSILIIRIHLRSNCCPSKMTSSALDAKIALLINALTFLI